MRRLKKIINILVIVIFTTFCCMFCFNRYNSSHLIAGDNSALKVYEVWHIESFEGGGGSRFQYLKNLALLYEKTHPTDLFLIKLVQAEDVEELLSASSPDLISFSEQTAKTILPHLQTLENNYGVKDNFLNSAMFNNQLKGLPYIASGYCYFTKSEISSSENLELYTANSNSHSAISLLNNEIVNQNSTMTSFQCYCKFVNSKNIKLLGTARDLYRLQHLQNLGRLSFNCEPVNEFSDLIQYLGIINSSQAVNEFIEFVINDENQINLSKIGLFSTKNVKLYTDTNYSNMENAINECFVPNIFK